VPQLNRPLKTFLLAALLLLLASAATFYCAPIWVNDHLTALKLSRHGVSSHYVQVDAYQIHYLESGTTGTPLVLIHGLGARAEVWANLIPGLTSSGFHVYAIDLLGFGRSPQPDVDYSMSLQEKTVTGFMQALHIPHADIAGWSMGGWVALKLTLDHPALVDRLIVFDAAGTYFPPTFDASLFTPTDAAGLAALTARLSPIHKPALPGFVAKDAIALLHRNGWVIARSMASMERGRDLLDFRLEQIHRPTLVVWGASDELIPASVGEFIAHQIPASSLLLITGCGHLAPAECSPAILPRMTSFLKAPTPQPPTSTTIDGLAP
jgi:pimeloyl-ACP methyl ester carboxylesterase